ncbi:MAG: FtsX-like permease family protein, partial [Acidobacteriota bacterium]
AASVRERIQAVDDQVPMSFATMDAVMRDAVADRRFLMSVIGLFSVVALALAAVGIYGVVSYSTARRTREMGIRLALGAEPGDVRRMVVRGALAVVAVGAAVGTVVALLLTRTMESVLFGVDPADPVTFAGVLAVLLATAWLASLIPARRGARTDPMVTMRED